MAKQLSLIPIKKYEHRKCARPISVRQFNHVVFKARVPSLRKHRAVVLRTLRDCQLRYGLRIKGLAIMENHIHLAVKVPSRIAFQNFMRVFAGTVALRVIKGKLWSQRVWSRVVTFGRELRQVLNYIAQNPVRVGRAIERFPIIEGILADTG